MDLDSRNKWLVENMPSVCETIQRYCDRDPELDYDELYLEMVEYLILRCDYDNKMLEYKPKDIKGIVGRKINYIRHKPKSVEEPYDPEFFKTRLYFEEFDKHLIQWEFVESSSNLTDIEKDVFIKHVFGENGKGPMTLGDIGKEYGLTKARAHQIFKDAKQKVLWKVIGSL